MLIEALKIQPGDILSDGTEVLTVSRSQGNTHCKLADGRRLIAPDHYLLGITRATKVKGAQETPDALNLEPKRPSYLRRSGKTS